MKRITSEEYIPTREDRKEDDYQPLFTGDEYGQPALLELTTSVEIAGVPTKEITINAPTVDQQMALTDSKGPVGRRTKKLIAECCNVPVEIIGNLHARDLNRISDIISNFTS